MQIAVEPLIKRRSGYFSHKLCRLLSLGLIMMICACHSRRSYRGYQRDGYGRGGYVKNEADLRSKYAALLGVSPEDIRDLRLYSFIEEWMGTPYRMGGTTHQGIDCSAFTQLLYREVYNAQLPRTSEEQSDVIHKKRMSNLVEGDLAFFGFRRRGIDHVGIYLGNGRFVHASTSRGVMINDLGQDYYHKAFIIGGSVFR